MRKLIVCVKRGITFTIKLGVGAELAKLLKNGVKGAGVVNVMDDKRSKTDDDGTYTWEGDDKIEEGGEDQGGTGEPGHRGVTTAEVGMVMGDLTGVPMELFEDTRVFFINKKLLEGIYVKENPRVLTIEIRCGSAAKQMLTIF
jgi:hypothetical protein